jgi:hypothetical protein
METMKRLFVFILMFAAFARADVTVEKELRATVAILTARIAALTAMNAALVQKLASSNATAVTVRAQEKTHTEEKGAVLQAQAETSETNATASSSLAHQIEFERQMSLLQVDLHQVVISQRYAMIMLILTFIIVLAFTGTVVYSTRRRHADARPE